MLTPLKRRRRDEKGATAIMFGVMALGLLGVSAVAIDLGQVYAKRASLQSAVDLAVLAAAPYADGSDQCTEAAYDAAEAELTANWIDQDLDPIDLGLKTATKDDGYLKCTGYEIELWAPEARVNFGLARAVSSRTGADVPAYAKAGVYSPANVSTLPAFAVSGCDFGNQTLLDPPGGSATLHTPDLPEDTTFNNVTILRGNPEAVLINANSSYVVTSENSSGANSFRDVRWVSFSTEAGDHYEYAVPATNIEKTSSTITFSQLPTEIVSQQAVWFVRVSTQVSDPSVWSTTVPSVSDPTGETAALQVGDAILTCAGVSNSGNFGTVTLPRTANAENANQAVAFNIIFGAEFSLGRLLGTNGYCRATTPGAILAMNDGTNCVDASVGLAANPATQGFITGVGSTQGLLDQYSTTTGCDPTGGSADFTTSSIGGRTYAINNDTLTCFFKSSSTTLSTITTSTYNGAALLDGDIYDSPRFFMVPVFAVQPSNGNSNKYSIIDFRPTFITGEQGTSTKTSSVMDSTGNANGLVITSSGIQSLRVVFFDVDALPRTLAGGDVTDYLGVGTKVVRLID